MAAKVALVTCANIPELEPDDQLVIAPLAALGITAEPVVWDDPRVDWAAFDLVVLRSPWDYAPRRDEFVAWAHSVPRLANAATSVEWNTDKRYLAGLEAAGIPVVPTTWILPGSPGWEPPTAGSWVVKPAVSAGSRDTGRYDMAGPEHRAHASAHVARLIAEDRVVMVQPYLSAVDTYGETALLFLGGEYSHAIRKGPMLTGPDIGVRGLYKEEAITPREPSAAERAVADKVLAAIPAELPPHLYARVDLIPGPDDAPMLVELEVTEPSLFLEHSPGAADRLAAAIAARL